jgi:hypothetical protein
MSEPKRISPQPFDRPGSPAATMPISGPDAEALAIIERAAMEMAGRRPPKRAPEPAFEPEPAPMFSSTFADDAPVLNAKPANDSAPWVEMKPPEEIVPTAAVKSADDIRPVELSPVEAPAPNEPASWVEAALPEEIIPSAEMKSANDVRPIEIDPVAFDPIETDPVEAPAPAEPIKPMAELKLVEQFDAATLVHPAAPIAPAAPTQAKATPPSARPMFDDQFRLSLTNLQSASAAIAIFAFVIAAVGMAASGWATAHDWTCRVGLATKYCPAPPVPKPLALPDIPS